MTTVTKRDSNVVAHPTAQQSALAVSNGQGFWSEQQLAALKQIGVDEASNGDLAVFLNYAQTTGLDPFARQIYMIGRWDNRSQAKKWTIQASIDGLRIVAQRSGEYAGQVGPEWCGQDGQWRDVWLGPGAPAAARVGVLRRGFVEPLYAVALLNEYAVSGRDGKLSGLWSSKPAVMIAKCAEALALRKAFPMDLSGLYTAEEMTQDDAETPAPPAQSTAARRRTPPPENPTGRDWVGEVENAADAETLRALYKEAVGEGAMTNDLATLITTKGQALVASAEDVVDAEVVDEPSEFTPAVDPEADEQWLTGQSA